MCSPLYNSLSLSGAFEDFSPVLPYSPKAEQPSHHAKEKADTRLFSTDDKLELLFASLGRQEKRKQEQRYLQLEVLDGHRRNSSPPWPMVINALLLS